MEGCGFGRCQGLLRNSNSGDFFFIGGKGASRESREALGKGVEGGGGEMRRWGTALRVHLTI